MRSLEYRNLTRINEVQSARDIDDISRNIDSTSHRKSGTQHIYPMEGIGWSDGDC